MSELKRLLWIAPEEQGGIRHYSETLWPFVNVGWESSALVFDEAAAIKTARSLQPDIIHIQHEFGLFGSRLPFRYRFPAWLKRVRQAAPCAKVLGTGHTVLDSTFEFPWKNRGWQTLPRWVMNQVALPYCRFLWTRKTWGLFDGVIVHSALQTRTVSDSGCPKVTVIPHFVGTAASVRALFSPEGPHAAPVILVFGYFSPDKGQDVVIRAFARLLTTQASCSAQLVLAGGARRKEDQAFLEHCRGLVRSLRLEERVQFTGYLSPEQVNAAFARAALVVAPFRETWGSGSLAQALDRAMPVLASDHPINREIGDRQPGALAFFRNEDPVDCANEIGRLLADPAARKALSEAARRYAEACDVRSIARMHLDFYNRFTFGAG